MSFPIVGDPQADGAFNVLYTTYIPDDTVRYAFSSVEQYKKWFAVVNKIKYVIEEITEKGDMDDDKRYDEWISLVYKFREEYGSAYVPKDIRRALKSVEVGLGRPITEFDE